MLGKECSPCPLLELQRTIATDACRLTTQNRLKADVTVAAEASASVGLNTKPQSSDALQPRGFFLLMGIKLGRSAASEAKAEVT